MASVTIMGAGIFGLSCAWEMTRRGARVRVLEAVRIGAGSSGGHVGALAPHAPENWNGKKQFQLESLLMAPDFWAEVETVSGRGTGYGRTGRIQPLADRDAAAQLSHRIEAAAARWPQTMAMRLTEAPDSPLLPHSPAGLWLQDGLSARLDPGGALDALAQAIRAKGGEIVEGSTAVPHGGPVLWTTGAQGLKDLSQDLGRTIGKGIKGQSLLLQHDARHAPQVFADGLHIVGHANGTTAIGSTSENVFTHEGPDDLLDDLLRRARAICPTLGQAPVIDRWAGIRPRAQSRAPLLGSWPGRPGHYVANGGFKIGFGMAPKIAVIIADLILDRHDAIPDMFRLA